MLKKDDTSLIKLDCKNKPEVYNMLFSKASSCLKTAKSIALIYLGSPYYAKRVLEEYNNIKEVNIFTIKSLKFIYEPFEKSKKIKIWYVDDEKDTFKECEDMKFDCIIMNPPYDGQTNLYGKITLEAKKHAKEVVCLSPYLNYISDKKSFKEVSSKLEKSLESYEFVDSVLFDAAFDKQLCIFKFGKKNTNICFDDLFWNKFSNKQLAKSILNKFKNINDFCNNHTISYSKFNDFKYKCVMTFKRGHFDKQNGHPIWDWTTLFAKNYQEKFSWTISDIKTPNCHAIPFNSENECKNFCEYCNSDIIAFIIYAYKVSLSQSSNLQYIPFLTDYSKKITDNDIKLKFNLTTDEMKYIYSEMKDFGWKTQK